MALVEQVTLAPIEEVVPGIGGEPTDEQWDAYNAHSLAVAREALEGSPIVELRYPSGAFDRLRLNERGEVIAVPTDAAPQPEPDAD